MIALAIEAATAHGSREVGAEHPVLGLVREGQGIAPVTLESRRVAGARVRAEVERLLPGGGA